jgi:hypothetical protein
MKMEAAASFKKLVMIYKIIRSHKIENHNLKLSVVSYVSLYVKQQVSEAATHIICESHVQRMSEWVNLSISRWVNQTIGELMRNSYNKTISSWVNNIINEPLCQSVSER